MDLGYQKFPVCLRRNQPCHTASGSSGKPEGGWLPDQKLCRIDGQISAVLFDEAVTWSEIQAIVVKSAELVKDVRFVDEYRGSQVPEGKKSIMLRLILGSDSTTLTSDQVEKTAMQIARKLEKKLGGELRGSISEQTK